MQEVKSVNIQSIPAEHKVRILFNQKNEQSPHVFFSRFGQNLLVNFVGMKIKQDVWLPCSALGNIYVRGHFPTGIVVGNAHRVESIFNENVMLTFTGDQKKNLLRRISNVGILVISQLQILKI